MAEELLRLPTVRQRTGLARATIYQRIKEGTFPKPIALGARAVAWTKTSVDTWIEAQIRASRQEQQQ